MTNLSKLKVIQTSPTTWDVFLDEKKLDSVRSLLVNIRAGCIPVAFMEVMLDKSDIETLAKVERQ